MTDIEIRAENFGTYSITYSGGTHAVHGKDRVLLEVARALGLHSHVRLIEAALGLRDGDDHSPDYGSN